MYPETSSRKTQKIIASFIVVLAVVLVTVGINVLSNKNAEQEMTAQVMPMVSAASPQSTGTASPSPGAQASGYKDGTYAATDSYVSPGGTEHIDVTLTIQNGTVTASKVHQDANNHDSAQYQSFFAGDYKSEVIGKKLNDIQLSRVSGSSLTSEGFNAALEQIKSQAQF
jgi:uncharacterized protein with FMN-binding domain